MKKCLECNAPVKKANKFCNMSCAAVYNNRKRTKESRTKQRESLLNSLGLEFREKVVSKPNYDQRANKAGRPYTKVRFCTYCNTIFNFSERKKSTCSDDCFIKIKTVVNSARKSIWYKGIRFDSSWELTVAQYLDENNIKWARPIASLKWIDSKGKERQYFPDFYLPEYNLYLDPKNDFARKKQAEKVSYLLENYDNIIIGEIEQVMAHLKGFEPSCIH